MAATGFEYAFNLYNGIVYPVSMREVVSNIIAADPTWAVLATPAGTLTVDTARAKYCLYMRENMLNPADTTDVFIVADGMSIAGDIKASPEEAQLAFDLIEFKDATNAAAVKRLNALYDLIVAGLTKRGVPVEPIDFGWFGRMVQYAVQPPAKK